MTKATNVSEKDGFLFVELEHNEFYPGGGGQPKDEGIIKNGSFEGKVADITKENEKIILKIKAIKGSLKTGDSVEQLIDKERRDKLTRMHTGEHILFRTLEKTLGEVSLDKIDLSEEESSLFIKCKELSWDKLFEIEKKVNEIIKEDVKITEKLLSKEDAGKIAGLRIKLDRIKSDRIRVIEIGGCDVAACTGTHARSSGFVGSLLITKFNQVKDSYELRFKVNAGEELLEMARSARKTAGILGTSTKLLPDIASGLLKENAKLKEKMKEAGVRY